MKKKKNKIKTKKALLKRIKITGRGKLMRPHQLKRGHLRRHKSKSALRRHARLYKLDKTLTKKVRQMLGI